MTPTGTSPLVSAHRRRTAAQFVDSMTGDMLPCTSDKEFRAALRSGVLLCRLMQRLDPNCGVEVLHDNTLDAFRTNISNFLDWVNSYTPPADATFTPEELLQESWDDTPRISECLCWLKVMNTQEALDRRSSLASSIHSAHSNATTSTTATGTPRHTATLSSQNSLSGRMPAHTTSPSAAIQSASRNGNQARIGVTKLMQQCSQLIRDRMANGGKPDQNDVLSKPDEQVQQMMGPVMEKLLGSLTQEYEKRLHRKENEVTAMEEKLQRLKVDNSKLELELGRLKEELRRQVEEAEKKVDEAALQQLEELRAQHQEALDRLRQKEVQVGVLEAQLKEARSYGRDRFLALEAAMTQKQERVAYLEGLEVNYKAMQEENRKLYNMVQDLKGSIRVFCRIRPLGRTGDSSSSCVDVGVDGELAIHDPAKGDRKQFKFDKIFDMASTQDLVYDDVEPLVRSVLDGYNVCIFAYGQTGSGKTHTMSGTNVHQLEGRGINYRALDDLFALRDDRNNEVEYDIKVQMLEIYNESLRDLLVDPAATPRARNLDILNTQASGCNVPGACHVDVTSSEDVMEIMSRGARNRAVGVTRLNDRSSRSHQILTVIVDGHNLVTGARSHGCLHLVDLAGSERVARSEATGDRLLEAQHINKSLSALGDVMSALASKSNHVPFRNSKLTQLLQDSLSGQAKVMMFMHIAPEASSHGETLSTLKFGTRVSEITLGQAKKNVESGKVFEAQEQATRLQLQAERQQQQIARLQAELQAAQAAGSSSTAAQDNLTVQLEELRFERQEAHAKLEASEGRLADALQRVSELTSQLAMYKAEALSAATRMQAPLHSRDSHSSQDSEPAAFTPHSALSLPRQGSSGSSGLASRSRSPVPSPRSITPSDATTTPRSATPSVTTPASTAAAAPTARRASASVSRHRERLLSRRATGSLSPQTATALPPASPLERPLAARAASVPPRVSSLPTPRPSLSGLTSGGKALSTSKTTFLSTRTTTGTYKTSRTEATTAPTTRPTSSSGQRPTSAERPTRRPSSSGWK